MVFLLFSGYFLCNICICMLFYVLFFLNLYSIGIFMGLLMFFLGYFEVIFKDFLGPFLDILGHFYGILGVFWGVLMFIVVF